MRLSYHEALGSLLLSLPDKNKNKKETNKNTAKFKVVLPSSETRCLTNIKNSIMHIHVCCNDDVQFGLGYNSGCTGLEFPSKIKLHGQLSGTAVSSEIRERTIIHRQERSETAEWQLLTFKV